MPGFSTDSRTSVSLHSGAVRAGMDASASEAGSISLMQSANVLSSMGRHSSRANALGSSVVRSATWRDVGSVSSSYPMPSPVHSGRGVDREVSDVDVTRVTAFFGQSPSSTGESFPYVTTVPPPPQAALAHGVHGFRDFVAHLPQLSTSPATLPAAKVAVGGSEASGLSSLDATTRPSTASEAVGSDGEPSAISKAAQSPTAPGNAPSGSGQPGHRRLRESTVPAHRIRSVTPSERAATTSPVAPFVLDVSPFTLHRRVHSTLDANDTQSGLAQVQSEDSGFVINATRRREKLLRVSPESKAEGEKNVSPTSTITTPGQPGAAPSPSPFPSNPLRESVCSAPKALESSDSGSPLLARETFQRYLDDTRKTVMSAELGEEERAKALDGLVARSRELFDLLDNVHNSFADDTERRRYSMLKVIPYDGMSASSTAAATPLSSRGGVAAAGSSASPAEAAAATIVSISSEEGVSNIILEPLSLTTRTYVTQLPPLGGAATLRILGGIERGQRNSIDSCSSTSVAYIDVVNSYCITRLLGIGATARAYLALDRKTNTFFAMKTVAKQSRRSGGRQFPPRPPSSLSDCSVAEPTTPPTVAPDNTTKTSPQHVTIGAAAGAVPAPTLAADGTSPSSIIRTTCFPTAAIETAKQMGDARYDQRASVSERGLREVDMEDLAQSSSHASGSVIPYVESVCTAESSSVSTRDGPARESGMEAVMMEDLLSRPPQVRQSNSFARRFTDSVRMAGNMTRPPIAPSALRAATQNAASKEKSAGAAAPSEADLSAVEREIRVMRRLQNHPHVVQLREVIDDDEDNCAHLIMTYAANGPLTAVHGFDPTMGCACCNVVRPFSRCARLLRQLADALIYVHRQRIVHNDVKPDNILLTESDNVLLTDFGESVLIPKRVQANAAPSSQQPRSPQVDNMNATVTVPHNRWKTPRGPGDSWLGGGDFNEQSVSYRMYNNTIGGGNGQSMSGFGTNLNGVSQMMMNETSFRPDSSMFLAAGVDGDGHLNGDRVVVGSPAFAAPELIDCSMCSYKSDTWSFGVVMYAIVFGRLPFAGPSISDTFNEILHAPLTFPPLEAVPQREELTEALYDQWVMLCSRLLIREPPHRLSLGAVLRHPLFRSTMAPSPGLKSPGSLQPAPDASDKQGRSAQHRLSPRPDSPHDVIPPISRTTRAKPTENAAPPLWSVSNEPLSRGGSPTLFGSRASSPVETPRSRAFSSSPYPPPPTPNAPESAQTGASSRAGPATTIIASLGSIVPTPPAIPLERVPTPPQSQPQGYPMRSSSRQEDDSTANQNSCTQLPSLPPSKGLETVPPSCSSNTEDGTQVLPSPPGYLHEKTLVYYQGSDLANSGRTFSPKEGSLMYVSNHALGDYRHGPSWHSPMSGALMVNCAVILPTSSRSDGSMSGPAGSSSQTHDREEMRRLGLSSRESRAHSHSGSEEGAAANLVSVASAAAAPRSTIANDTEADVTEHLTGDRSVGGATRRPPGNQDSLSNLDEAFSRHEVANDYYSYWNESENDSDACESSCEEGHQMKGKNPPEPAARNAPQSPRNVRVARLSASSKPKSVVPMLSNQEEVASRPCPRSKVSVMRTKREKVSRKSVEKRPSKADEGRADADPWDGKRERPRRGSNTKANSLKATVKPSQQSTEKRQSAASPPRETAKEECSSKQSSSATSRSWFSRRH